MEEVLYDDDNGLDLLIDGLHNVNMRANVPPFMATHATRDGAAMRVLFHEGFRTYYIEVA